MRRRFRPSLQGRVPLDRGEKAHRHRGGVVGGFLALAGLLVLSGLFAQSATAAGTPATIPLASGTTPVTYAINGGASGAAVNKCRNAGWGLIGTTSWIGVSPDCTAGDAASNRTTVYTATFTLPAGYTAPSISGSFLADDLGTVALNGTNLAGNASYVTPVNFSSSSPANFHAGVNQLVFTVTDTGGPNGVDFSATVSFTQPADLSVTKTAAPDPVLHGQNVTYTVVLANAGPGTASAPTVVDTLPAGQTLVSSDAGCTGVGTATATCTFGDLASGSSITFHIVASTAGIPAPLAGPLTQTNSATASSTTGDPNSANNTGTAPVHIVPAADLSLVKTASPNPVIAGQQLTYTLTTTNNGPDTAVAAQVVDTLPPGTTFLNEGTPPAGSPVCTPTPAGSQTITCQLGDIPAGGSVTATIVVAVTQTPPPGSVFNTATASSTTADPNLVNNTSTTTTTVTPSCTTTITGNHVGAIDVPAGTFLCLVNATQTGAILVDPGGALTVTNSTVTGGIQSNGAVFVTLCGSTINGSGSVIIKGTTLLTRVGDDAINCAGNNITGSVNVSGNTGGVEVFGNTIKGSLSVDNNRGASPFADGTPEVEGNTVGSSLACAGNTPPPINEGMTNTVTGAKLGQCINL
ncbi:MAG: DUF11 domain-containing protein [Solirubrobacteraceae bacterium]